MLKSKPPEEMVRTPEAEQFPVEGQSEDIIGLGGKDYALVKHLGSPVHSPSD